MVFSRFLGFLYNALPNAQLTIAVLADTHNRYPSGFLDRLAGADEIWHLGDVCEPSVIDELGWHGHPVHVVRGNNDFEYHWPLTMRLERAGLVFHLEHIPPRLAPKGCDVVLHGHTHVPRDEQLHGVRWLNPGAISYANRGAPASFAWLTITGAREFTWKLTEL